MLVTFLSLFFFVVVMIFSLSTDVSKLPQNVLVPEMFSVLNVPAAKVHYEAGFQRMRYMLTVSAVCGLSGAVLSSFLPGSRIINALSSGNYVLSCEKKCSQFFRCSMDVP
ncbi:hypothetical protein ANCCAN_15009 [Ancylostoma caninum]|uniref:Amino acid transporter transmembrane domain-containing protein n=1 Tax=Ancylostoma caninum TaxID=29170 RepID=A0A368G7V9_ANCCA|nr:hypothetical protein ANCCAN_15009 [Ancylostoma caninum]